MKRLIKVCLNCGHEIIITDHEAAVLLGSKTKTSVAKAKAARRNGRKGGRPPRRKE